MTLVADSKSRVTSSELFRPGARFAADKQPDGRIILAELVEKEVAEIKCKRTRQGFIMSPVKVERTAIRAALRADRDSR